MEQHDLTTVVGRIQYLMAMKNMNQTEFCKKTGISTSSLSAAIKNGTSLSQKALNDIILAFPDIDANWLFKGGNSMLKATLPMGETDYAKKTIEVLEKEVDRLSSENQNLWQLVNKLTGSTQTGASAV